ncbi:uncharacterized protein SCHCODRAFT_01128098, partial [Schizophyllum commune H4-8]|uniref:uncharacterized protein n=1 Tax=Schizophyllum commune (strain H4-8 / FGSC 9210) TaxID=578458 RepID=UPI00215FD3E2
MPKMWFNNISRTEEHVLHDFDELLRRLESRFDEADLTNAMLDKIEALWQTGSAANYIQAYDELAKHVDFSDMTKKATLYKHLKPELKDLLLSVRGFKMLPYSEYTATIIEVDNDMHRRAQERQQEAKKKTAKSNPSSSAPSFVPQPTPPFVPAPAPVPRSSHTALPAGEPMEIDATKTGSRPRAPLTQAEKDRRRREGLCSYC